MRKLKLLMVACMAMCGLCVNAAVYIIDQKFTSVAGVGNNQFTIVNETEGKAIYNSSDQNLAYDVYSTAVTGVCYQFVLESLDGNADASVHGMYALKCVKTDGTSPSVWGRTPLYLNSGKSDGFNGCFVLDNGNQLGTDFQYGGVWEVNYVDGSGFTLKNKGIGGYFAGPNSRPESTTPIYWTFCTLKEDVLASVRQEYNDVKTQILASAPSIDLSSAQALADAAQTEDDIKDAIAKLYTLFKDYLPTATNVNATILVTNPSFELSFTGWTNNGMATQGNNSFLGKVGNTYCEAWQPNGTKSVSQTITGLPEGLYSLSANSLARGVTSAKLYADGYDTPITIEDASNTYDFEFMHVGNGNATIGFEGIGTGAGASWICVDNFQLTYVRALTAEDFKAEAVNAYNEALAAATAIADGTIPAAAYTGLQNVISSNTLSDGTSTQYNDAATALNSAATTAGALVAPYAAWKDLKSQADVLVAVSNNNATANSTFSNVISTQNTEVENNATNADDITSATSALKTAMTTYVTTAEPTNDECFDLTFMIVNPHFTEGNADNPTGWTAVYPTAPENSGWHARELRTSTHNFEAYRQQFTLSQTIPNLPKGTYKVTLQGFTRHDGDDKDKTNLFCGIANQKIKEISEEYSTTSLISGKPTMGDNNGEAEANGQYRPNGMSASYYYFQETNPMTGQPFYTNEVQTLITDDGDLTIGFKCETWTDWVIWDNFHLYYYGSAIAVSLDETTGTSYSTDIENANVTLNKTIFDGWNTITIPFEANASDFGGEKLYSFSGDDETTLNFTEVTTGKIEPNIPYLLKATSASSSSRTFNGVIVKAADGQTATGTNYNFVGTYTEAQVADGDYILGEDAFYRSAGGNKVKAYRAYVKKIVDTGSQARLAFVLDGMTTAIDAIDGKAVNNAAIYNLSGQKVEKAQKGIYIQNGKKMVIK